MRRTRIVFLALSAVSRTADNMRGVAGSGPATHVRLAQTRFVLAVALSCLIVAGCTAQPRAPARFEQTECRFELPQGETIECGDLIVPESRDRAESPEIRLHVAIVRSHSSAPAPDPIVYLEGGPGVHALDALAFGLDVHEMLLAERDLIFFDQRGVGHSQPSLDCPELNDTYVRLLDSTFDWRRYQEHEVQLLIACADRLRGAGRDLSAYNSLASAADLEELRLALGYESWNLLAFSYGTRLALTTMREYPQGIRSVVLDSPLPLQVDLDDDFARNFYNSLNLLFERCQLDVQCAQSFPDLKTRYWALVNHLASEPLSTLIVHPQNGQAIEAIIDGNRLIEFTRGALYRMDLIPLLPRIIVDLERGLVNHHLRNFVAQQLVIPLLISEGMSNSVWCSEEAPFRRTASETVETEELPGFLHDHHRIGDQAGQLICEAWQARPAPAVENEPVTSAIPTLLIVGDYDPVTPPVYARLAAATLSSSQVVEFPGVGHLPYFARQCARNTAGAFFVDPIATLDTGCVDASRPFFLQR
jgi:pimeloyl-ACP methyl ester carboxylesterase